MEAEKRFWHTLSSKDVLAQLDVEEAVGLRFDEIEKRRETYGVNNLTQQKNLPAWRLFLLQFHQPLIYILLLACVITALLEEWVDCGVIFAVVFVNALIGYIQEAKALKAIEALSKMSKNSITVLREGQKVLVDAQELVVGDVVILYSGDKVPADLKLLYAKTLQVDEALLTGESISVEKQVGILPQETLLADRTTMLFASTLVTYGHGIGVVVEVGDATQIGKINALISSAEVLQTPLTQKIASFSLQVLYAIVVMAIITFLVGVLRGEESEAMFMASVALAVGAIPEGLPAAMTIILAIGVAQMALKNAIIRKLPAVETLGSITVICSDKTGTLTQNAMSVTQMYAGGSFYALSGSGYEPKGEILAEGIPFVPQKESALYEMLVSGVLCSTARHVKVAHSYIIEGDPTEGALIVSAKKGGIHDEGLMREFERVDTLAFESEYQYMAISYQSLQEKNLHFAYAKGSVEKILERCESMMDAHAQIVPIDKETIVMHADAMASQGLRILAFAKCFFEEKIDSLGHHHFEKGLIFLGLQGMMDPPRIGVKESIKSCYEAGIGVKMITGDHAMTAKAIAHEIGIVLDEKKAVLTGKEIETLDEHTLREMLGYVNVFARIAPEQKLRLVRALQANGHIVAMTGDGVNDAPALRQANIGIAMGITGTEVAKESADMILTDDNFLTIKDAIEEGRGVFDNIIKFITWTLPTSVGEGLIILCTIFAGVLLPILPVQILWINMSTAIFLGITLAYEHKEHFLMQRAPRNPKEPILTNDLLRKVVMVAFLLVVHAFGAFFYLVESLGETVARTVVVNIFVFGEMFYLFNCRSLRYSMFEIGVFSNLYAIYGVLLMSFLQLLFTYMPWMNQIFNSAPLGAFEWGIVLASSFVIYLVMEVEKRVTCKIKSCYQ
ncbi:HAD-IC family P-type ATPase [Sulfurospirillum barnesii]|uniref:P-type ATPase, translocating n=1 Tax=Sulfurospirillum barnesii (strain ATCC 700032 / DSM 10660 / SES-3) TaxID=760154 RepID=I3XYS3_SULBS|nr:HAD-IC family P-type ATPase [Sulfurospirillum barnesii]AFL69097.1 P-type ATPase, translocating [Sulfurospirillum barnesii SES-3]